jgi:hypothetical protein
MSADQYTSWLSMWRRIFQERNPTSTVAIQDDDHGCFPRLFNSVPNGPKQFEKACQPAYYIDGLHSKTDEYNSSIISLVVLNGNSKVILLVIAWCALPGEVTSHTGWFTQLCLWGWFRIRECSDLHQSGNLLVASCALKEEFGITLSLKYCLQHIMRNLVETFFLSEAHYHYVDPDCVLEKVLKGYLSSPFPIGKVSLAHPQVLQPTGNIKLVSVSEERWSNNWVLWRAAALFSEILVITFLGHSGS